MGSRLSLEPMTSLLWVSLKWTSWSLGMLPDLSKTGFSLQPVWCRLKEETHSPLLRNLLIIIKQRTCETPPAWPPCFISRWLQHRVPPGHLWNTSHEEHMASTGSSNNHSFVLPHKTLQMFCNICYKNSWFLFVVVVSGVCKLLSCPLPHKRVFLAFWAGWVLYKAKATSSVK